MSASYGSRLPAEGKPVYLARQVAARLAGVHDYTIDKYCEPDAWRLHRDGKLHPMYLRETIEIFRAEYRDGRTRPASAGAK